MPKKITLMYWYYIWMSFNAIFIRTIKVYFTLVYNHMGKNEFALIEYYSIEMNLNLIH